MTQEFVNAQGQNEVWLDQTEVAEYFERTVASVRNAYKRFQELTGKEIEKVPDGNKVFVRQSDLDELIRTLYPMLARRKGLV